MDMVRRDDKGGNDCFPALGEGFRINAPLLKESIQ